MESELPILPPPPSEAAPVEISALRIAPDVYCASPDVYSASPVEGESSELVMGRRFPVVSIGLPVLRGTLLVVPDPDVLDIPVVTGRG